MIGVVVDASAALAWALRSQATAASARMIEQADSYRFTAPAIFSFEVFNVLVSLSRRGSLDAGAYHDAVAVLTDADIRLAEPTPNEAIPELAEFAKVSGLSLFDASYLRLALVEDCGLATRDAGLIEACQRAGVAVYDFRG
jgi:predicted nucleic acid-binding protein